MYTHIDTLWLPMTDQEIEFLHLYDPIPPHLRTPKQRSGSSIATRTSASFSMVYVVGGLDHSYWIYSPTNYRYPTNYHWLVVWNIFFDWEESCQPVYDGPRHGRMQTFDWPCRCWMRSSVWNPPSYTRSLGLWAVSQLCKMQMCQNSSTFRERLFLFHDFWPFGILF